MSPPETRLVLNKETYQAVIGEIVSDLASGAKPGYDLAPFAFDREILREPDPVRRFLT